MTITWDFAWWVLPAAAILGYFIPKLARFLLWVWHRGWQPFEDVGPRS